MSHQPNRESVKGHQVAGFDEAVEHGAGAFYFVENDDGLYIGLMIPGEDGPRELPINTGTKVDKRWLWDGNREAPTLMPSIAAWLSDGNGGLVEHWHGWMKNGNLESC